jgi:OmcA/MtrC family decaheme c-type cytochrome
MKKHRSAHQWFSLLAVASVLTFALSGCGSDGDQGAAGAPGATVGVASAADATALTITVTGVTINSAPVVNFTVTNQNGVAVSGFADTDLRFNIAKLVPGSNGDPSKWQSYLNRVSGGGVLGTQERAGSASAAWGTLVDHKNGTFTYTFKTDITNPTANPCPAPCTDADGNALDISYQAGLTHRVGIQQNNTALPKANATFDFVPAGGAVATTREIISTAKCNECHNQLAAHGGGMRIETKLCVTCHNPGSWFAGSPNATVDFKVMVHKIHSGEELPSVVAGTPYTLGNADFSDVVFPQDIKNCTKCHDGTVGASNATAQGDNWKNRPSMAACGSCHDNVYFGASPDPLKPYQTVAHTGGPVTDNSVCTTCHVTNGLAGSIAEKHPVPVNVAATKFQYNILEICGTPVGSSPNCAAESTPTVRFSVTDPTGATTHGYGNKYDVAGPTNADRDPEFGASASLNILTSWMSGKSWGTVDGIDYTNDGGAGDRPARANSLNALTSAVPHVSGDGTFTITLAAIPAVARSGVIAIEGHPRGESVVGSGTFDINVPVKGEVAYFGIGGSSAVARRVAVDVETKCDKCHNQLALHGANRAENAQLCVLCHNPRNTDVKNRPKDADGLPNATAPDGKYEESIDLKRLIHGIHAARRDDPSTSGVIEGYGYREKGLGIQGRNTSSFDDFSHIRFPGILNDCTTCHNTGTYELTGKWATPLQNGILATTMRAAPDPIGSGDFATQIANQSNDLLTTPTAAVCSACHDEALDQEHMATVGGAKFSVKQADIDTSFETCSLCHGPGGIADVKDAHGVP